MNKVYYKTGQKQMFHFFIKRKECKILQLLQILFVLASIVTLATPFGAFFIGPLMDKYGRKRMCLLTNIPFAIGWLLHYFATNIWYIYVARVISGFSSGERVS